MTRNVEVSHGIPTVTDRVAQMVIKNRLEPILEKVFHQNSYAYRPNKSAIDAVGQARETCFRMKWVKGTPQGGVISPILANLYLHEAFDLWISNTHPGIRFERYADDIIVHCVSEKQAHYILNRIKGRLSQFKLELNPEKTKVIYAGSDKRDPDNKAPRKFTFLGYEFKPRGWRDAEKKFHMTFSPSIGAKALKNIRQQVDAWKLHRRTFSRLKDIAKEMNPIIRGWIEYYGHFRRSELYKMAAVIDLKLVKWLKRKHKSLESVSQAWGALKLMKGKYPKLFPHWYLIQQS